MSNWSSFGKRVREEYENALEPEALLGELIRYKDVFADFELRDLLNIYSIRVKSEIAAAIIETPEYMAHEIGKMRTTGEVDTATRGLYDLAESVERCGELINHATYEMAVSIDNIAKELGKH